MDTMIHPEDIFVKSRHRPPEYGVGETSPRIRSVAGIFSPGVEGGHQHVYKTNNIRRISMMGLKGAKIRNKHRRWCDCSVGESRSKILGSAPCTGGQNGGGQLWALLYRDKFRGALAGCPR